MKFISNENFPLASVRKLRELGYDVLSISMRSPGISDLAVLRLAVKESRVLLTFDDGLWGVSFHSNGCCAASCHLLEVFSGCSQGTQILRNHPIKFLSLPSTFSVSL